jgi:NAD(P)-dependent dehydrogenase (short-subunit alcohol dehydrogenase family)
MTANPTPPSRWDVSNIPPQAGRLAVITGATGGLGFETALALAGAGAEVLLTGRDQAKGDLALGRIRDRHPGARIGFELLDLASLASVRAFVDRFGARTAPAFDLLVNNAGVMALPRPQTTVDGFERQLATNFLGHFALTLGLLPCLRRGHQPRVVNLSSIAHRQGRIRLDDLQGLERYDPWRAYCQSKLAMLMFALELQRRSDAGGWGLLSAAAHPGVAVTGLVDKGPGADGHVSWVWRLAKLSWPLISQSAAMGALPTLFAATAAAAPGGYYGPDGFQELKGHPAPARIAGQARDARVAAALWEAALSLTGAAVPAP